MGDRYCDALLKIRHEIAQIETGRASREDNVLKNAPHSLKMILADEWGHPYSREDAAFPAVCLQKNKFWPAVSRANDVVGDKNVIVKLDSMVVDATREPGSKLQWA